MCRTQKSFFGFLPSVGAAVRLLEVMFLLYDIGTAESRLWIYRISVPERAVGERVEDGHLGPAIGSTAGTTVRGPSKASGGGADATTHEGAGG